MDEGETTNESSSQMVSENTENSASKKRNLTDAESNENPAKKLKSEELYGIIPS